MNAQMKTFIDRCLPSAKEAAIIYGTGTWDMNDVYRHPAYEEAYEMGKSV